MSGPEVSSDAELIAALQEANAGLRRVNAQLPEAINTQGVHIEALTGQIEALSAQLAAQVARIAGLERRPGSGAGLTRDEPLPTGLVSRRAAHLHLGGLQKAELLAGAQVGHHIGSGVQPEPVLGGAAAFGRQQVDLPDRPGDRGAGHPNQPASTSGYDAAVPG